MKSNKDISNARYYANAAEQQILVQGLQRYFSLPERSQNRNKITKEVSQFLQCFSPHWSHRAVRLWFNNNKHSYFNTQNLNAENINNSTSNFPINNNINMKINVQAQDPLMQNSSSIPLSNSSMQKVPLVQIPGQQPGIQFQNFNQIAENRGSYNIQGQGNALPTNFNAINPMMQKLVPPNEKQQQQQATKQQFIVPQIAKSANSALQAPQSQMQSSIPTPSLIPAPPTTQPPKRPLEVKIAPKIPQPQIHTNPTTSINSSSSLPPSHFQRIPTPQIDSNSYNETPKKADAKKKVTVMPPIKISSTITSKPSISSSTSSSFGQSMSYWGSNPSNDRGNSPEFGATREKMCKQITALLDEIRETPEDPLNSSSLLKMKINEFERMCRDFRTQYGFLSPQIIDPSFKFTRFPIHDPVREMPSSLSSLSLSLMPAAAMNDYNDGYGGEMGGFMYNDMGSLGNLSAFGRSDSNFSLNAFSPSTSMNLINDTTTNSASNMQDNSFFGMNSNNGNDNEQIEGGMEAAKNRSYTYSSSPSFAPSTSSSIDASMAASQNVPSSIEQRSDKDGNDADYNSGSSNTANGQADSCFLDHISQNSIWQARSFKSTHIPYFECAAMSKGLDIAAYAYKHIDFSSNKHQRAICFTNSANSSGKPIDEYESSADIMHESWKTVLVDCHLVVESMVVDDDSAWLLTNREIIHSSLFQSQSTAEDGYCASNRIELPHIGGSRFVSFIGNRNDIEGYGVVACFSSSSDLLFVNSSNDQEFQRSQTCCSGISCIAPLSNDLIACGVPLNGTVVLVNKNGDEVRSFVGHCGEVLGVYPLFSSCEDYETNLFASRADDNTVRVWDIRERVPLFQITTSLAMTSSSSSSSQSSFVNTPNLDKTSSSNQQISYCSFLNVDGNDQYLMFGLHHQIGVIDIRKDFAKPILGVTTDDYDPVSLHFNQELNTVGMFGEVENVASRDSMLFVGNDGQSRKRIFRTYNNFIG